MERDIEIMRWILGQKFMIREQTGRVFWKGGADQSKEDCRRLRELKDEGFPKMSGRGFYRKGLYLVTKKGVKVLWK